MPNSGHEGTHAPTQWLLHPRPIGAKPAAQNLDLASDDTVQASLDVSQVQGGGRSAPPP